MHKRLIIIAGPERSGKLPLARKLMEIDPSLALVHRDSIRDALIRKIDEGTITNLMGLLADKLLGYGHSVLVCAWNLHPDDYRLWKSIADKAGVEMQWLDVREPQVACLIPPIAA